MHYGEHEGQMNSAQWNLHNNRKYTTVKDIITTKPIKNYTVLDNDNNFQLEISDFPGKQNYEILVRERAKGTKLDSLLKKKGTITKETAQTVTISNKKRQRTTNSKRDVAIPNLKFDGSNDVHKQTNYAQTTI